MKGRYYNHGVANLYHAKKNKFRYGAGEGDFGVNVYSTSGRYQRYTFRYRKARLNFMRRVKRARNFSHFVLFRNN